MNDYAYSKLAEQHRQDLVAEVEQDRLARVARAERAPWWARLGRIRLIPATRHRIAH